MQTLNLQEIDQVSGGISDDAAWGASIGLSAALIGIAIVATGPVAMAAIWGLLHSFSN